MKKLRVYIDTSVIAGCLDDEFSLESNQLMEAIKQEKFILLMSDIIVSKLINAPQSVKDILLSIPQRVIEVVKITAEVLQLRNAYINEGVVTSKSINDATHVAAATIARADAIISWNFKHIDCLAFKQTSQEKMAEDMKNLSYSDQIEYLQKKINESDLKLWWESINNKK